MKIKFGAIVTDGRGKLGGHVFSKNGGGSYMRTKVTPTNPQTTAQNAVRALFGAISAGWSALTASQRAGFNGAVSDWQRTNIFGDLKKPSGKALYQRLNNQAQVVGFPAVNDVPARVEMPQDALEGATIDITAGTLTVAGLDNAFSGNYVVSGTPTLSAGTKFVKNRLRQVFSEDVASPTPADAYNAYVAKYGVPTANDNIYIGVKYVAANGQASALQTFKATVSA